MVVMWVCENILKYNNSKKPTAIDYKRKSWNSFTNIFKLHFYGTF